MKKIILVAFIIKSILMFPQQKGIIYYGFVDALGVGNSRGLDYNAYMIFNNEQSYYATCKDSLENSLVKDKEVVFLDKSVKKNSIYLGMKTSPQGDQVVYNVKKNTIWSNFYYRKQTYVKEVASKIDWTIEKEFKKIGKFNCKKAITYFRGRNYIAWFTPEISTPFGPWKLNGLPGLILEAYDTNKNYYWYFKSVEYPTKNKNNVEYLKIPKSLKFNTYDEFKLFQKNQLIRTIEKERITQKIYPDVIFTEPKLLDSFIECE